MDIGKIFGLILLIVSLALACWLSLKKAKSSTVKKVEILNTEEVNAETLHQKAALLRIKQIKKELEELSKYTYWDKYSRRNLYLYSLEELEKKFEKYIKEVEDLIKEHELDLSLLEKFKEEGAKILYDAAMEREGYDWAAAFAKKYNL
jgi:hypothetical protein